MGIAAITGVTYAQFGVVDADFFLHKASDVGIGFGMVDEKIESRHGSVL